LAQLQQLVIRRAPGSVRGRVDDSTFVLLGPSPPGSYPRRFNGRVIKTNNSTVIEGRFQLHPVARLLPSESICRATARDVCAFSALFPGKSAARRTSRIRLSGPERGLKASGPRSTLTHPESTEGFFDKVSHTNIGVRTWLTNAGECSKQRRHQVLRMSRLRLLLDEAYRGQLDGF